MKLRIHVTSPELVHGWPDPHTVHWLDRAFQITRRTIMNCICSECTSFNSASYGVPMWERTTRTTRIRCASFSFPSSRPLLPNMLGMLPPNIPSAKWSVKIPAGPRDFTPRARLLSPFSLRCATRSKRTDSVPSWGWIGAVSHEPGMSSHRY